MRGIALLVFLVYFALTSRLLPQATQWDGLAFLERIDQWTIVDPAHPLYLPLLRGAVMAGVELGLAHEDAANPALTIKVIEMAAKALSALGAALATALLVRALNQRMSGDGVGALAIGCLFATSPLLWRQAGVIEPSTWTLVALLLSDAAAHHYRRRPDLWNALRVATAFGLALGFHVVSILALPWVWMRARHRDRAPPAPAGPLALGFVTLAAAIVGIAGFAVDDPRHLTQLLLDYTVGFLPQPQSLAEAWSILQDNFNRLLYGYVEGGLLLLSAGTIGALLALGAERRRLAASGTLFAVHLVAHLLLGRPSVALLLPQYLAIAEWTATGFALGSQRQRAVGRTFLAIAAALQLSLAFPEVLIKALTPDTRQSLATRTADLLPENAVLFGGSLSMHLRAYSGAEILSLPDLLPRNGVRPGDVDTIVSLLQAEAERSRTEHGGEVFIADETLRYLSEQWGCPADAVRSLTRDSIQELDHTTPITLHRFR